MLRAVGQFGRVALLVFLLEAALLAQKEETSDTGISTDRPGFRDSTRTVPRGAVQLETGMRLEGDRLEGRRLVVLPEPILRVGLGGRWEARVSGDGRAEPVRGSRANGFCGGWSDVAVGTKVRLHEASEHGPRLSLIGMVSLPVGSQAYTSGGVDPALSLIWKQNLTEHLGLGGTLNVAAESGDDGRRLRRSASVSATRSLPWELQGYAEAYVIQPMENGRGNEWASDAGVARRITEDMQVDVAVGRALRHAPQTWFVTVGFAVRWKHAAVGADRPFPSR